MPFQEIQFLMGLLVFSWIFCALSRKVAQIQVTFLWPSMVGQTLTKEIFT